MRSAIAVLIVALTGIDAQAHDARPLSITLVEQAAGVYRAVVRTPPSLTVEQLPRIEWPNECELHDAGASAAVPGTTLRTSLVTCSGGLANHTIRISYPLYNPSISTLISLETLSGVSVTSVLPPDQTQWTVPTEPDRYSIAREYARLGFVHIWEGPDHLLFVAGLLLLAVFPRRVFWAVTGFTAAHSITLSLAALGLFRVPIAPTEALIALSIVFLAAEIARHDPQSFSRRYPVALSFAFGLLHGFGFASALGEIGLPGNELATGLLFFNAGVEIGQLAFIAVAVAVLAVLWGLSNRRGKRSLHLELGRVSLVSAYCLGVPAAFWFIERTISAFA